MNLHQLQYFDCLSQTLHYQRAAEQLGISQPALSRSISALEAELGVPLFERRGRGVELSRYGAAFASHISLAMQEINTGVTRVCELADPGRLTLNLGVNYILAASYLPGLARAYQDLQPERPIFFQFHQGNTLSVLKNIKDGICDLGFCSFVEDQPEIQFHPVISMKMCVLAPAKHPLLSRRSLTLEDVARFPLVLSLDHTYYLENLFRHRNLTPAVSCRTGEDRAIAALVAQGFGLAIVPYDEQLRACGVELLSLDEPDAFRTYYLARSRTRTPSEAARAFWQFTLEHAEAE